MSSTVLWYSISERDSRWQRRSHLWIKFWNVKGTAKKHKCFFWWHQRRGYIWSLGLQIRFGRGVKFVFTWCQSTDLCMHQLIYLLQVTTLLRLLLSSEITFSPQTERTAEQKTALLPSAPSKDCLPKTTVRTTHGTSPALNFFLLKNPTIYKHTASPGITT